MLGGIFICYRREDTAGFARLIYDRLTNKLGRDSVFFDVDNIAPGLDFVDILSERVGKCDVLIAVIGKTWVSIADVHDRRRLDDPSDFVRIEIEAALERKIRVIPVLVDGAPMPRSDDLPDSLKKLTRRHGIEISHSRFDSDVDRLTRALSALDEELRQREAAERSALEEQEKREAAEAAEKAEQARRLAEAEAQRADKERRAREAAEVERTVGEEREKREAANGAEKAERARQLVRAQAQRVVEERRAADAAEAESSARAEWVKREADERPAREQPSEEAEASEEAANELRTATELSAEDVASAAAKPSVVAALLGGRNWAVLTAATSVAVIGTATLLVVEFGGRKESTRVVDSTPTAQPGNVTAAAPSVAPPLSTVVQPERAVNEAAPTNAVAVAPSAWPTPGEVMEPESAATPTRSTKPYLPTTPQQQYEMAEKFDHGRGVNRDFAQALALYQKAADQGYADAQIKIAELYESGDGVKQDYAQAVSWYKKAADQGNSDAQLELGYMYYAGRGVKQDYAQAFAWYQKAADHGDMVAQDEIGELYERGLGVDKNLDHAREWYQKAADRGQQDAKRSLERLRGK